MHGDMVSSMQRSMEKISYPPQNLVLEIAESIVSLNIESVGETISKLHAIGVGVQIDDFGTGNSSLLYLKELPIHALKIDRAFVHLITENGENTEIPRMVISLAHELGIKTIAEGIETTGQFIQLRQMGCDDAQGYLFCNPLDKNAVLQILEAASLNDSQELPWSAFWDDLADE